MSIVVFALILNTSTPSHFTFQSNTIPNPNFTSLNLHFNKPSSSRSTPSLRATNHDCNNHEIPQDGEVGNLGVKAALSILRFYKREISPILPRSCRFSTCSEYSMEAYKNYGVLKGTTLTVWRLCRCNPLGRSGYDPPRWFGEIKQGEELDD